jgi:hypothetical protein
VAPILPDVTATVSIAVEQNLNALTLMVTK